MKNEVIIKIALKGFQHFQKQETEINWNWNFYELFAGSREKCAFTRFHLSVNREKLKSNLLSLQMFCLDLKQHLTVLRVFWFCSFLCDAPKVEESEFLLLKRSNQKHFLIRFVHLRPYVCLCILS